MKITLDMLLTSFKSKYPEATISPGIIDTADCISGIRLLPTEPAQNDSSYLYLCDITHSALPQEQLSEYHILCVCPDQPPNQFFSVRNEILFLYTSLDLAEVFNFLLSAFMYFADWENNLDFSVYQGASMQELTDLSENMLDNPMMILDPALKVIAYTKNHTVEDDAAFSFAIKNGYLSPESVRLFEEDHTFEQVYTNAFLSSGVNRARAYSDMIQGIKLNDGSVVYVVLLHNNNESKTYVTQLFKIFSQAIEKAFRNQKNDFHRERYVEDYFLIELLENRELTLNTIHERLQYIRLPFRDYFLFCSVYSDLRQTSSEQYFINTLRNMLPDCHIFSYDGFIAVLFLMPHSVVTDYKRYAAKRFQPLQETLRIHHAKICISKPFFTIDRIYAARQQTKHCFSLAQKGKNSRLYEFYENYSIQNLFAGHTSTDLLYDFCDSTLQQIYATGDEKSIYQMKILESYLRHERKSSAAADELKMHRNNVTYHINQICEKYHWNLNNPNLRLKLRLSFSLLKYVKDTP